MGAPDDDDVVVVTAFASEAEADAEARRLNRELAERSNGYFYVAAFVTEDLWNVERHGGPAKFSEVLRHALRPWRWAWW